MQGMSSPWAGQPLCRHPWGCLHPWHPHQLPARLLQAPCQQPPQPGPQETAPHRQPLLGTAPWPLSGTAPWPPSCFPLAFFALLGTIGILAVLGVFAVFAVRVAGASALSVGAGAGGGGVQGRLLAAGCQLSLQLCLGLVQRPPLPARCPGLDVPARHSESVWSPAWKLHAADLTC